MSIACSRWLIICLRSTDYVNVIVSDKQLHLQYLDTDAAIAHCTKGLGIWDWASTDQGDEPDVVLVGCGDIPAQEALAASVLLREAFPKLKIRFVNVIDLFKLQPETEHPPRFAGPGFRQPGYHGVDKPEILTWKWPLTK
jgi:xylulose-5-phosphate/fructose-6-phosphate phosphoketolase